MEQFNYNNFEVEDFLADESFQAYCKGNSHDALIFWENIINENSGLHQKITEAKFLYQLLSGNQGDMAVEKDRLISRIEKRSGVVKIYRRWYAAASIALIIGLGVWSYQYFNKTKTPVSIAKATNDVTAPTANRAMITLADGRTVFLDSLHSGAVAQQGNIQLVKLDNGQIAYKTGSGEIVKEIQYNTLSNPRGSKVIDMTLTDGTQVWLNAGSSITYPVAFVGDKREVTLKGEGYFEVAKDAAKPFHVNAGAIDVQVLGTHFNVSAYSDEKDIKTTLLEGQVKVSVGKETTVLKPGQQAQAVTAEGKLTKTNEVDLDEVMAWKNGKFIFQGESIKSVMKQIERWYNIEVAFEPGLPDDEFVGVISRFASLSEVLSMLSKTAAIRFEVSGKKVTVLSK